jgi:hypothetical protein
MTEQHPAPGTSDDDTSGHGRYHPGDSEHEHDDTNDDTVGHGRGWPGDSEREDDDADDDTAGHHRM